MNWLQQTISIKGGTDFKNTPSSITENISMRGTNAWMMICSALLASIGLDTNSTAVIIGAMLISPLMSPILGVGYSVRVHDRELFIRSIRNLGYATLFSLLASVVYFIVTPLGEPTSEILSRTKPTLLDIGVAFFGGVAGIVSGSRKDKTNAIPGVAIATALMPPLCASGYGLARGQWQIFGGAFYLFFINAVFIALSTYLIVGMLRFPIKQYVEPEVQKKAGRAAIAILVLISIPSVWFLYTVYRDVKTRRNIEYAIVDDFRKRGNEILKWELADQDSIKLIKTLFSGQPASASDIRYYNDKLKEIGLKKYRVEFQRINMSKAEVEKMGTDMLNNIMKTIELQNARIKDSLAQIIAKPAPVEIYTDIKAFYPAVYSVGASQVQLVRSGKTDTVWMGQLIWDSASGKTDKGAALNQIQHFLQKRLHTDTVWLYAGELPSKKEIPAVKGVNKKK